MKHKNSYKPAYLFLILMAFTFVTYGQQITLIDFGVRVQQTTTTPQSWNNFIVQNSLGTAINLIDNTGGSTGATLTLTDVFDRNIINNEGTRFPVVTFGGLPLPTTASRDSFFGESKIFNGSTETTGGFTLSGLEVGNSYSFRIFASRVGVSDNRETLYTLTGSGTPKTATLDAANNTSNVATIFYVQPNSSGEITIQATTGPNNTNSFGFYYLGAIEITKSCLSTVTWNGSNWSNGTGPTSSTAAIINGDYTTSATTNITACSLTVNAGAILTVSNGTYVEVQNNVSVAGEIYVDTQGAFVQRGNIGTFNLLPGGKALVQKQTPLKAKWYFYTYWSSPVVGATIGNTFPLVDGDRRFWFDANKYLDQHTGRTTNGNPDDIDDNGDDWQYALAGETMSPGKGYAVTEARFWPVLGAQGSANFSGEFNTRNVPVNISYNPLNTLFSWNFIGNPYPSAIDFHEFYLANSAVVEGVAYFWSQASPPLGSNSGNQQLNFNLTDYAVYSYGLGDGTKGGGPDKPTRYIPSGQGFFIPSKAPGGTATFTNDMRMANPTSNTQFFKNTDTKSKTITLNNANKLWVNLTSDNGVFGQILVGYVDGATNGLDGLTYDAPKAISEVPATLYWVIENSTKKFAIQGKDANSINENEIIKVGFKTTINVATLYTLSIDQLNGDFLTGNTIYLNDNLLNTVHNLSASDYTFTSAVGEFNSRFEIAFTNKTLAVNDVQLNTKAFKIVELQDDLVQFNTNNNLTIKAVNIYDLLGRALYQFKGENSSETYRLSNLNNTVYIAKVTLSDLTLVTKKAVKK